MPHGLGIITAANDARPRALRYTLLSKLPGGLRSDIWLAVRNGSRSLEQVVVLKVFVPHVPGHALDNLSAELYLAEQI